MAVRTTDSYHVLQTHLAGRPHKTGQYNTKIPTHQRGKFVVRVRVRVSVSYVGVNVIVTTVLIMVLTLFRGGRKGERNKLVVGVG